MSEPKLVIGSKAYSSWSLRPWLLLRYHNAAFKEVTITLDTPETKARILEYSPSGRVPVLINGPEKVWESLAICEYAAEILKLPDAWPSDTVQRYHARSLACEMHAGFTNLRNELPMDCRRAPAPHPISDAVAADIKRVRQIWRGCRKQFGRTGDWLFGKFGIVDAMYAPVALRFHTYGVPLDGPEQDYLHAMLNLPALREWLGAAMLEPATRAPAGDKGHAEKPEPAAKPAEAPAPKAAAAKPATPAASAKAAPAKTAAKPEPPAKPSSSPKSGGPRLIRSNIIPD